eukprot:550034_1
MLIAVCIYLYYKQKERYISNALVVLICIGHYDDEPTHPSIEAADINDLDGVKADIQKLTNLFEVTYNYTVICDKNLYQTDKQVKDLLKQSAETFSAKTSMFDALIVICSGHGWEGNIITSDWRLIQKDAIHRFYSIKYPHMRNYPRIFLYDVCEGDRQKVRQDAEIIYEESDEERKEETCKTHIGKGLKLDDIQQNNDLWVDGDVNPDYQTVQIHACNKSFQSKMDTFKESYMITCFVEQMERYLGEKTLSKICDSIQHELHQIQKIQHTTNIFNDKCGYLKFKKNDSKKSYENDQCNDRNEL